jgi:hypothetical protein
MSRVLLCASSLHQLSSSAISDMCREVDLSCRILLLVQDYAGLTWAIQAALEAGRAAWYEASQQAQLVETYRHHIGERNCVLKKCWKNFDVVTKLSGL